MSEFKVANYKIVNAAEKTSDLKGFNLGFIFLAFKFSNYSGERYPVFKFCCWAKAVVYKELD
jgi:hypothetical protein